MATSKRTIEEKIKNIFSMKSYTDIEQSKKLAKILPLESADMCYLTDITFGGKCRLLPKDDFACGDSLSNLPCWTLACLLEQLPYPQLSKDKLGSGKVGWMVSVYPNDCRYDSCWHDNPIDACVAMIEKLHELNLL